MPCPYTYIPFSIISITSQWYICYQDKPRLSHHNHPKPTAYLRVHSQCSFKCMTQIRHYIIHGAFTVPQIFCAPHFHLFSCPSTPAQGLPTLIIFIVSKPWPFPECHMVGIIWYIYSSSPDEVASRTLNTVWKNNRHLKRAMWPMLLYCKEALLVVQVVY